MSTHSLLSKEQLAELTNLVMAVSVAHDHLERLCGICNEYEDELSEVLGYERLDLLRSMAENTDKILESNARDIVMKKAGVML